MRSSTHFTGTRSIIVVTLQQLFGDVIRAHRAKAGLSQEDLADEAGLHRTYIGLVERGQRMPSIEMVRRLALALDTSMTLLMTALEKEIRARQPDLLTQQRPLPFNRILKERRRRRP